jgi:anti-sigma-K factor RskA
MTWDHNRVEELLAGHALGVLDPDDSALVERALVEHVPECTRCRRALGGFEALAGDLALAAAPAVPPDGLRRRVLWAARRPPGRARAFPRWLGAAAAALAVAALAGWNLLMVGRLERAEARQALMIEAVAAVGRPDAWAVPMQGSTGVRATMIYVHGSQEAYFVASGLPQPQGVYQLWLVEAEGWVSLGTFTPQEGIALVRARAQAEDVTRVVVTAEPEGGSDRPSGERVVSAEISRDGDEESGNEGPGGGGSSGPG